MLLTGCPEDIPDNHPCHYYDEIKQLCLPAKLIDKKKLIYETSPDPVSMNSVLHGQCFPPGEAEAILDYARRAIAQKDACLEKLNK